MHYERAASGVVTELDAWLHGLAERLRYTVDEIVETVRDPVVAELSSRFE